MPNCISAALMDRHPLRAGLHLVSIPLPQPSRRLLPSRRPRYRTATPSRLARGWHINSHATPAAPTSKPTNRRHALRYPPNRRERITVGAARHTHSQGANRKSVGIGRGRTTQSRAPTPEGCTGGNTDTVGVERQTIGRGLNIENPVKVWSGDYRISKAGSIRCSRHHQAIGECGCVDRLTEEIRQRGLKRWRLPARHC